MGRPDEDEEVGLRSEVLWFAQRMERELLANDHKEHWRGCSLKQMLGRLRQEVGELEDAIEQRSGEAHIISEAADVANFAMFIADIRRGISEAERPRPEDKP